MMAPWLSRSVPWLCAHLHAELTRKWEYGVLSKEQPCGLNHLRFTGSRREGLDEEQSNVELSAALNPHFGAQPLSPWGEERV